MDTEKAQATEAEIAQLIKRWMLYCTLLRTAHGGFIVVGTSASLLVPFLINAKIDGSWVSLCSLVAALFNTLAATFRADVYANRLRRAWAQSFAASLKYNCGLIDMNKFIDAYAESEAIIGDVIVDPRSATGDHIKGDEADPSANKSTQKNLGEGDNSKVAGKDGQTPKGND